MTRHRTDAAEYRPSLGPLFEPSPRTLTHRDGPAASRKAAGRAIADGTVATDTAYLRDLILRFPMHTMAEYGEIAAGEKGGDPFAWRLKLGRRTGMLKDAGIIWTDGERDGMSLWISF